MSDINFIGKFETDPRGIEHANVTSLFESIAYFE